MNDADKPFICYRQGWWGMSIQPRNSAGWRAMFVWMLALLVALGIIVLVAFGLERRGWSEDSIGWLMAPVSLIGLTAWGITMIRWMLARSEVIDFEELLALKRERDQQRRRR